MERLKIILSAVTILYVAGIAGINGYAEENKSFQRPEWFPEISADVAFETKYVWRGQTLVDDIVVQPGASISMYDFTFSVWGNYDAGSLDRFTEWDYIFDYTTSVGQTIRKLGMMEEESMLDPLSISLGYIYYTFPNLDGDAYDSHEFYVGLSYDAMLRPSVMYYADFDSGEGSYWEFGIGHTFAFDQGIEANVGAVAGYNAYQWGYDNSFTNLLFSGDVAIPLFEYMTISPNVNYSLALDDQYDHEFFGGVNIAISY